MSKINSNSSKTISVACSVVLSDNKDSVGMARDKAKYGLLTLTKMEISAIFDRFINEGKATLRFKRPPQDILIQSKDSNGLKLFVKAIKVLRSALTSSSDGQTLVFGQLSSAANLKNEQKNEKNNALKSSSTPSETTAPCVLNEHGKRSAAANVPSGKHEQPLPKKRLTSSGPIILKKSETIFGKTLRLLIAGGAYASSLNCEKCRILSFARCTEMTSLASLELIDCGLESFPEEILSIPHLNILSLSRNKIPEVTAQILSSANKLTNLDLSSNNIKMLPLSILNVTTLRVLSVRNNQIKVINALPPSLVRVDISQNPLCAIWANKMTKFFGDVDISGIIATSDNDESQFDVFNRISEPIVFRRQVPTLFEFAARSSVKNWLSSFWKFIPPMITAQVESQCLCSACNQLTITPALVRRLNVVQMGWRSQMTDATSLHVNFSGVRCQVCAHAVTTKTEQQPQNGFSL